LPHNKLQSSNSTISTSSYHHSLITEPETVREKDQSSMASTQCFLHHHALTTPARSPSQRTMVSTKPNHLVCKAQKQTPQEDDAAPISRRLALTVLIGAAAVGSKVQPADAAYGEAGISLSLFLIVQLVEFELDFLCHVLLFRKTQ